MNGVGRIPGLIGSQQQQSKERIPVRIDSRLGQYFFGSLSDLDFICSVHAFFAASCDIDEFVDCCFAIQSFIIFSWAFVLSAP